MTSVFLFGNCKKNPFYLAHLGSSHLLLGAMPSNFCTPERLLGEIKNEATWLWLQPTISGHSRESLSGENSFFITMATVVKITIPQYFSCYRGPMTHLCAKFHQDWSKNEEEIMSKTTALYVYDMYIKYVKNTRFSFVVFFHQ